MMRNYILRTQSTHLEVDTQGRNLEVLMQDDPDLTIKAYLHLKT